MRDDAAVAADTAPDFRLRFYRRGISCAGKLLQATFKENVGAKVVTYPVQNDNRL